MYGEIITIGNELVSGRTLDLNGWYAAGRLTAAGLQVTRVTSVGDDHEMVSEVLTRAIRSSRFVIITGGLGSTEDDRTNEIVAEALNRPLTKDPQMFCRIKSHVEARGLGMTSSLEKMAWMPEGSRMLNPAGTACGFCLHEEEIRLYFLPGVPDQMRYLMDKFVLPEMLSTFETLPIMRQRVLKLYGINEPRIAEIFKDIQEEAGKVVFGFYPQFPENHVTLSLRGREEEQISRELDRMERRIRERLGSYIFAAGNETMEQVVGGVLTRERLRLSVAESCTGGLIGHRLTGVPGSSDYFMGGVVAYSDDVKIRLLGVLPRTLERFGAVSDAAVREMAAGIRKTMNTDLGLAVTGIAGPGGGRKGKPVGTVFFGLAARDQVLASRYRFGGDREQVKRNASMMGLDWVRRFLNGDSFLPGI